MKYSPFRVHRRRPSKSRDFLLSGRYPVLGRPHHPIANERGVPAASDHGASTDERSRHLSDARDHPLGTPRPSIQALGAGQPRFVAAIRSPAPPAALLARAREAPPFDQPTLRQEADQIAQAAPACGSRRVPRAHLHVRFRAPCLGVPTPHPLSHRGRKSSNCPPSFRKRWPEAATGTRHTGCPRTSTCRSRARGVSTCRNRGYASYTTKDAWLVARYGGPVPMARAAGVARLCPEKLSSGCSMSGGEPRDRDRSGAHVKITGSAGWAEAIDRRTSAAPA